MRKLSTSSNNHINFPIDPVTDMRSLIDTIVVISEGRGLAARKPGEEFISTTDPNEKIYLQSVQFFPEGGGTFPSHEETMAAVDKVSKSFRGANVTLERNFNNSENGFGVAVFTDDKKKQLVFIKPFRQIMPDPTQNQWDNQTGIPGYRYNSKTAAKSQAGMMAQDILTRYDNLQPKDIVKQISDHFGATHPLTQVAKMLASGQSLPIAIPAPEGLSFPAFRDYFCELLHPIALKMGQYEGEAGDAAKRFLGPAGFANTSINFSNDKTEGLSDSIMVDNEGKKIKVSSKGGAHGAEASTKNIMDSIQELSKANPKLLKKHKETVDILSTITEYGQYQAPLILGEKYGIITYDDIAVIQGFKNMPLASLSVLDQVKMSKELKKLLLSRTVKNPDQVNLYTHSVSAVAHAVASYINKNTNFSQSASEILNNSSLVQVYNDASEAGGKWTIKHFNTKWPGSSVKGIEFSAEKNYFSTDIKGNFTFRVLRGNAKE